MKSDYVAKDALKFQRVFSVLLACRHRSNFKKAVLFVLHSDPSATGAGGTERHVDRLIKKLGPLGVGAFVLFPGGSERLTLRFIVDNVIESEESFQESTLPGVLSLLADFVEVLHVHHWVTLKSGTRKAIAESSFEKKIFTAHDFFSLCPSFNLLKAVEDRGFCAVEPDLEKCNRCLAVFTASPRASIEKYRQETWKLWKQFDLILFPSEAMRAYFKKGAALEWQAIEPKACVLPHDLSYLFELGEAGERTTSENMNDRVAFVGVLAPVKGQPLVLEALRLWPKEQISFEVWGRITPSEDPRAAQIKLVPFESIGELKALYESQPPSIVVFPSLTAESFCYSFYESLILSPVTVPVVSPLGNPAEVVRKHEIGVVMENLTAEGLVKAVRRARDEYPALLEKKTDFVKKLKASRDESFAAYLEEISSVTLPPLPNLNAEHLRSLAEKDDLAYELKEVVDEAESWQSRGWVRSALGAIIRKLRPRT